MELKWKLFSFLLGTPSKTTGQGQWKINEDWPSFVITVRRLYEEPELIRKEKVYQKMCPSGRNLDTSHSQTKQGKKNIIIMDRTCAEIQMKDYEGGWHAPWHCGSGKCLYKSHTSIYMKENNTTTLPAPVLSLLSVPQLLAFLVNKTEQKK